MRLPLTFQKRHVREHGLKGGVLRGAGVDAEPDSAIPLAHMADAHLAKAHAVDGIFDAVVVFAAAEAVPHRLDGGVQGGCGPVGVSVIGHDAAQMLVAFVFIFNGSLQPVFAVQVHDDAALVKPMAAFGEIGFHHEAEILLVRLHLERRGVVVS